MIPTKILELSDILHDRLTYRDIASIHVIGVPIFNESNLAAIVQTHRDKIFNQERIVMKDTRQSNRHFATVTLAEMVEYCLQGEYRQGIGRRLEFIKELMSWGVPVINRYIDDRKSHYDALRDSVTKRREIKEAKSQVSIENDNTFKNLASKYVSASGILDNSGLPQEKWKSFYEQLCKLVDEGKVKGVVIGERTRFPDYKIDLSVLLPELKLLPILEIDYGKVAHNLYRLYYSYERKKVVH